MDVWDVLLLEVVVLCVSKRLLGLGKGCSVDVVVNGWRAVGLIHIPMLCTEIGKSIFQ